MSQQSRRIQKISAHAGPVPGTGTVREATVAKLIDVTTCIGCRACEIACQEWNDLPFADTSFQNDLQTMPDTAWNVWTLVKMNEVSAKTEPCNGSCESKAACIAPTRDASPPVPLRERSSNTKTVLLTSITTNA